jgi:hypothetical protein
LQPIEYLWEENVYDGSNLEIAVYTLPPNSGVA